MLTVYVHNITPRLKYIFHILFCDVLGIKYILTENRDKFITEKLPKFNYSDLPFENELFIRSNSLLFENIINPHILESIKIFDWNSIPVFFPTNEKSTIPFDIFAASFFLVSRYEEYLNFKPDNHGRFPATQSLAYLHNFLQIPIIHLWAEMFKETILTIYPNLTFELRKFQFIPTIDIDNTFAYKFKGLKRITGAFIKSLLKLNLNDCYARLKVFLRVSPDPYDTYNVIENIHENYTIKPIFFFLCAEHSKFDKNIPIRQPDFRKLIKYLSLKYEIGIHPGYYSNLSIGKIKQEIQNLSDITEEVIVKSRMHFIRLKLPQTYQKLIQVGIKEDYSMGYASHLGFRASICIPFYYFDLEQEKETTLKIFPFAIMDATLSEYMKSDYANAILKCRQIIDQVKKYNGNLITIWHNESFNKKSPWNIFYINLMNYIFAT
jgi:hypothetical protein